MQEKELIVGKPSYRTRTILLMIGGGLFGLGLLLFLLNFDHCRHYIISSSEYHFSLLQSMVFDGPSWIVSLVIDLGLIFLIVGIILYISLAKVAITVTDKRVFGTATWGRRVDLPLDSISAVSTSAFKGVAVATSSGTINFKAIENYKEIHETVGGLLIDRQNKSQPISQTTIKQEIQQSDADELKKYKELLDSGIITQEEFDAKKKQLLGV